MATQSSTAVLCRAVVMLTCLVAIPLVAVSGGSLPRKIEALVANYWPTASSPGAEAGEPPRFHPTSAAAISPMPVPGQVAARSRQATFGTAQPGFPPAPSSGSATVVPVGFETPATAQPAGGLGAWHGATPPPPAVLGQGNGQLRPVQPSSLRQAASPSDPFTTMQARLQQLGATYVLLESMGNRQEVYRCYCRMAVGGDPSYAYYFEAVNSAPLEAMAQVVRQVEQWRAGRP